MYKVHIAKVADKLFLVKLKAAAGAGGSSQRRVEDRKTTYDATSNGNGQKSFMDVSEQDNIKYREICDGYENEIQVLEDGQPNFFQYLKSEPLMVGHHIFIGSFGLSVIVFLRGGLGDCIFSHIYIMEASTPFVSFRSILSTLGMKEHRYYVINGILMMATFFIFRILLLPYLFLWYSNTINVPVLTAIAALPRGCLISVAILFLPQYYWFYLIVRGALKVRCQVHDPFRRVFTNNIPLQVFFPKKGGKSKAGDKTQVTTTTAIDQVPDIGDGRHANGGIAAKNPSKTE